MPLPSPVMIPPASDRLSHLSDDVLSTILALLPFEEGARTAVLSSRWRHFWSQSPLNFDDSSSLVNASAANLRRCVACILSSPHRGPIHSFRLSRIHLPSIDEAFQTLARSKIFDLSLDFSSQWSYPPLPPSILSMSSSLRVLALAHCSMPDITRSSFSFPSLEFLSLEDMLISDECLLCFLPNCLVLERLRLRRCSSLVCIRIRSRSLKTLEYEVERKEAYGQVLVEDACNLERLILCQEATRVTPVRILHAPNLRALGYINVSRVKMQFIKHVKCNSETGVLIHARTKEHEKHQGHRPNQHE